MEDDSTVTGSILQRKESEHSPRPSYEARLVVIEGKEKGRTYTLPPGVTVLGRTRGNIQIDDRRMSRKHAVIEILGTGIFYLKDLASSNGTYLNDKVVTLTKIQPGDLIRLGDTVFKFYISEQT